MPSDQLQKKFPDGSLVEHVWRIFVECQFGMVAFCVQIKGMKERLDFWCGDVKNMAMLVEQQAHDILT